MNKMNNKKTFGIFFILMFLISSAAPASANIGFGFDKESKVQVFGGTFRDVYLVGDNVTLFAVLWEIGKGGLGDKQIVFTIYREGEFIQTIDAITDESGFAEVTFVPEVAGRYRVEVCYGDTCTLDKEGEFIVIEKVEPYYFIPKDFMAKPNSTIVFRWTLIDPFTRLPYSEPVNLTIPGLEIEKQLTPVNGTLEYALNLGEVAPDKTGDYEIYLDGRNAGRLWITSNPRLFVVGDREIYEGDTAKVLVFLYDPVEGKPVSGELNLTITYYLRNGSVVTVTKAVKLSNGYYILNISNTVNVTRIYPYFRGYNQGWGYYIYVKPKPTEQSIPEVIFEIEPSRQIAYPGQSFTLFVKGYNTTNNLPPKGNYTLTIKWYGWDGRAWDWPYYLGDNKTLINFGDQNEVMRRMNVPEDAYYGEVFIGNAHAEIYVIRPTLDIWSPDIDYEYNGTTNTFKVANETEVEGYLRNRTWRWYYDWNKYYNALPNETVYLFYWNGTKVIMTDTYGRISTSIPVNIDERLPLGFGMDGIAGTQNQWYLAIHESGAWDWDNAMIKRDMITLTVNGQDVTLKKFKEWWRTETSTPVVVEILKSTSGGITSIPVSEYWNTSELSFSLKPGIYEIRVLPNEWLSFAEYEAGIDWNLYSNRMFAILPEGTQLFQEEYTTDKSGYLEIPIKLPEKGVFFVRYWQDGYRFYFNKTDENGNGVVKIYVPTGSQGMSYGYGIYYGFMTEHYAILGAETRFTVKLTQDTLPPAINLEVTPQVQDVGKNVTIRYEVVDSGGIDTIKVEITNITDIINSMIINVNGSTLYSKEFSFTIRKLEDYMIKVWANDTRGNAAYRMVNFFGRIREEKKLELSENKTSNITVANKANIAINANDNASVAINVTVASDIENESAKFKMEGKGFEDLTYIKVETNETVNYNWVILNLTYDESILKKLGIPESAVTLFYWNGSEWIDLSENVGKTILDNSPYGNITIYSFGRDTDNNYVWANVSHLSEYALAVKLPDLIVAEIKPDTAYTKEETQIKVTIKNIGGATDKTFKVALYIDDILYSIESVAGLGADESKTITFAWIPSINGTFVLKAVVDYGNDILESNETNNEKSSIITVVNRQKAIAQGGTSLVVINFLYYTYYNRMIKKFDELYNKSLELGVANETLHEALKYRELAEKYYKDAQQYGPILHNIASPKLLAPLRKAYLNLKKAIELLENEVNIT